MTKLIIVKNSKNKKNIIKIFVLLKNLILFQKNFHYINKIIAIIDIIVIIIISWDLNKYLPYSGNKRDGQSFSNDQ